MNRIDSDAKQEESNGNFEHGSTESVKDLTKEPISHGGLGTLICQVGTMSSCAVKCAPKLACAVCSKESKGDHHDSVIDAKALDYASPESKLEREE